MLLWFIFIHYRYIVNFAKINRGGENRKSVVENTHFVMIPIFLFIFL
jgi:hypothetical protein